jgi:hypothetical protein
MSSVSHTTLLPDTNIKLPPSVIDEITNYISLTKKRGINRKYKTETDANYCQKAAFIYNDDMLYAKNTFDSKVIYYYSDNYDTEAILYLDSRCYKYKIYKKNNTYVLSMKHINVPTEPTNIIDIDLVSKYNILKNRGCEDVIPNYAKTHTLDFLLQTFVNNFNPDKIEDILYLYVYLHSNTILLNYNTFEPNKKIFKVNKLPSNNLLNDIYHLYNLLHVHFTVNL